MHKKALPAALALLAALCAPLSLAQPNVILPSSPEDYSKLAKPALPPGPCTTCGVVTNAAPAPAGGYAALAVVQESFVAAADLQIAAPGGARIELHPIDR